MVKNWISYAFMLCLLFIKTGNIQASHECNKQHAKGKHILFIAGGGSHIHPTVEIVKRLVSKKAKVTYVIFNKESKEGIELQKAGAFVISLWEVLLAINPSWNYTDEQKNIIDKPASNFVDQPEGVLDTSILSQYLMALFWDDFVLAVKNLKPDVIIYDVTQAYWAKYVGGELHIPAFASFAPALPRDWKNPDIKNMIKKNYFQLRYPATQKRIWAADYLHSKLGDIGNDIDVDFPIAFADPNYATFIYTYPKLMDYNNETMMGSKIVFAGYPSPEVPILTEQEQKIVDEVQCFKKGRKLVFISMGTEASKPLDFFAMLADALGNGNNKANDSLVVALHPGKNERGVLYNAKEVDAFLKKQGHTNIIVYDYYPLPSFFKFVDVFIGHGGNNCSMQALQNYVPMLLLPVHGDQIDLAETFQQHDLAKVMPTTINPMPFKDNFTAWHDFVESPKRGEFVQWIQQSVQEIIDNKRAQKTSRMRRKKINALLQNNQGYEAVIKTLLE